jgi:hypothetical protein
LPAGHEVAEQVAQHREQCLSGDVQLKNFWCDSIAPWTLRRNGTKLSRKPPPVFFQALGCTSGTPLDGGLAFRSIVRDDGDDDEGNDDDDGDDGDHDGGV